MSNNKQIIKNKHIAIAGNIGSGKTTLASLLAKHFDWMPQFDNMDKNPYIESFYGDMQRWAFNLQVYFLESRFSNIIKIKESNVTVIQDRTIYEDAHIFAPNLMDMGLMNFRDYGCYMSLFNLIDSLIDPPDLLIYLKASVPKLMEQILKRGRNYEGSIRLDYLNKLNQRYEHWISHYTHSKIIVIDIDDVDFENNPENLGEIINKINVELNGLF